MKGRLQLALLLAVAASVIVLFAATRRPAAAALGPRVTIQYWEIWTGPEADAMQAIVDKFNASQDRITVNFLSVSDAFQKLLLATAGGNPPDVAGMADFYVAVYAEKGALTPLNSQMQRDGLPVDRYIPAVAEACQHRGFVWALPTVPACLALHYNKKLFREAGLDAEQPPRTLDELARYARKLTKTDSSGRVVQLGFSPADPGWWSPFWPVFFGANLSRGGKLAPVNGPEAVRALEWAQSYPKEYGLERIQTFSASAGQFASSQNLFIAGKLAMQLQGMWMYNYISQYNPKLEWGAAPFPAGSPELTSVTLVEGNMLSIPKGSKHPEQAWEFIRFVQRQENLEALCLAQKKISPLKDTSDEFYARHPNPYIRMFRELAASPNAQSWPRTVILQEYLDEMNAAFDEVWLMRKSPKEALNAAEARLRPRAEKTFAQWERVKERRLAEWAASGGAAGSRP